MIESRPGKPAITADLLIPNLLRAYPETRAVLERHNPQWSDRAPGPPETLRYFARAHGLSLDGLIGELRRAVDSPVPPSLFRPGGPTRTIYRYYFLGSITLALASGLTLGVWMLLSSLTGAGPVGEQWIWAANAHGQAQVFGWIGLFLMGFAYLILPQIWRSELVAPRLASTVFVLMVGGLIVRVAGLAAGPAWAPSAWLATLGGWTQAVAVVLFAGQIVLTYRRSHARLEPYVAFVLAGLTWFVLACVLSLWHTAVLFGAGSETDRLHFITAFQIPLRDLQVHGMALFLALGLSLRLLPPLYGLARVGDRRAWWALDLLVTALVAEFLLYLAYRITGNRAFASGLPLAWLMLAAGVGLLTWPWRLWRRLPGSDPTARYIRAAYAWLGVSLVLLVVCPACPLHADSAAGLVQHLNVSRHALTIGFLSLLIMGLAWRIVPALLDIEIRPFGGLWGPFVLVNLGCLLRVAGGGLDSMFEVAPGTIALSGALEVAALAWWGLGLARLLTGHYVGTESSPLAQAPLDSDTPPPSPARPNRPNHEGRGSSILILPG